MMNFRWNLSLKLNTAITGLTVFSVLVAGILTYQLASTSAHDMAQKMVYSQLEATRSAKAMEIESYFQSVKNQIISLSDNLMVIDAMGDFTQAAKQIMADHDAIDMVSMRQQLGEFYNKDFSWQYKKMNPALATLNTEQSLHQLDDLAVAMQYQYIANNPNPLGKKYLLDAADHINTQHHSPYAAAHKKYHFHFRELQRHMGYDDLFLVEPEQGRVVYSVFKELDFGTRLKTGPWADSGLAEAYQAAMQADSEDDIRFTDMAPYAPSYEDQAMFVSSQIKHEGKLVGILVMQIPISEINKIMTNDHNWQQAGAGKSGESYIVGSDLTMRSASRFQVEDEDGFLQSLAKAGVAKTQLEEIRASKQVIGHVKVDTHAVRAALKQETGIGQQDDYRGISVLSAYQPLDIAGQHWVLISEIDAAEAFSGVAELEATSKQMIGIIVALLALLALLVGIFLARKMMRPMQYITKQLQALSRGQVGHDKLIYAGDDEISDLIAASQRLDNSMQHAINQSKAIAEGDFSRDIEVRSESDELGYALQQMNQMLKELSHVAAAIATGDLSADVHIKGPQDQLGRSISQMTHALRIDADETTQRDWLQSNIAEISQKVQGETQIHDLANTVMTLLPPMLSACHASFYAWKNDSNMLILKGHYAGSTCKLNEQISLGEGLTGQCARDKALIIVEDVPEDYLTIQSSMGSTPPRHLVEMPLIAENNIAGVIELALLNPPTELHKTLLQQLSPLLGVAVHILQQNIHTHQLLEESQAMGEELQAQEEELREANTTLETRAEELMSSEEELQAQQEELRQSNDDLISKNDLVEAQKNDLEASASSLLKQAEGLKQASQYKSDFLSNMSHELRTPLNSLLILSDMLAKNKGDNLTDKQVEFAQTIHASGEDLLALINSILDLAKVEAGKMDLDPHRFPVQDISDAMRHSFTHMAEEKGVTFGIEHASNLPEMMFNDAMRIKQVLKNLLSNALKFTHKGNISLSIDRVDETHISFAVTDSGVGIAADKLDDIFEAFQQEDGSTSRKYGGTGLGLSLCREFSRLLGGHIAVQSEQGKGSTFTLMIPIECDGTKNADDNHSVPSIASEIIFNNSHTNDANERIPEDMSDDLPVTKQIPNPLADDRNHIDAKDHAILIIEDDKAFASIQQGLVQEHGFKAINALRGDHGLMLALQYLPDAILLDLQLPVLDGMSLLDRFKQHPKLRHIPVHVISCMDQGTEKRVLQAGALSFIHKPASKKELDHVLDEISEFIQGDIKRLFIVEDDHKQLMAMSALLEANDVEILSASTGADALEVLRNDHVDCMILDLSLPDMKGEDILEIIAKETLSINKGHVLPIIVHTGKDLSEPEVEKLQSISKSIIVKGSYSPDRLLAETSLFLHQIEERMPEGKQQKIKHVRELDTEITGKTVLLVDDDIRNIYSLSSYLEGHQVIVHSARNGQQALDELIKRADDIDLVLMDIMMPVMDGFEAMQAIRKIDRFKNLPIIALTAKAMKGDRDHCISAGASDYITKPIDTDKLISLMRVWLHE